MTVGLDLISTGYLPGELPPTFASKSLATYAGAVGLPAVNAAHAGGAWTRPAKHNLARPAGLRRTLTIPSPLNYLRLAECIEDGWQSTVLPLLSTTRIATSRPTHVGFPRAFAPLTRDTAEWRARARSGSRFVLKTDIQNFYPSIYTHSIPWALHTKSIAKVQKHHTALLGNRLDKAIREGQDGQTMGVPIGPDASWVVAECILSAVENELRRRHGDLRGHRYIDDWELASSSISDAETLLSTLQAVLAEFELSVNPRKTSICELPDPVEEDGIGELRRWSFASTPKAQRTDIVHYFDKLSQLVAANRGGHTASYAVARLRTEKLHSSTWQLLEANLLMLLAAEPSCAKQVATTMSMLTQAGHKVTKGAIAQVTELMTTRHAPLGHGSEVAWVLWLSLSNAVPLSQASVAAVATMEDCVVALLALDAEASGLVTGNLDTSVWAQAMTADDLRGPLWLLAYEAAIKGWLPCAAGGDHIAGDPFFATLRSNGVTFYDTAALSIGPFAPVLTGSGGGGY